MSIRTLADVCSLLRNKNLWYFSAPTDQRITPLRENSSSLQFRFLSSIFLTAVSRRKKSEFMNILECLALLLLVLANGEVFIPPTTNLRSLDRKGLFDNLSEPNIKMKVLILWFRNFWAKKLPPSVLNKRVVLSVLFFFSIKFILWRKELTAQMVSRWLSDWRAGVRF